ncbi:MAG: dihydropteroate synthase [Alphaproteobacteria bacterium]|nr:dihydropteroate synthase [Alphaproteobacteria bacterium]
MADRIYLEPIGLVDPSVTGLAGEPFLGGPRRFIACRQFRRGEDGAVVESVFPISDIAAAEEADRDLRPLLDRLVAVRPPFADVPLDRPVLMGVLNVTPDSFSDGGDNWDFERAIEAGLAMVEAGAGIIDVGGESTRPGAREIDPAEEIERTEAVVRALADAGATVSIDTRHAAVMAAALSAGARIINDVSALTQDRDSLALAADSDAGVILMHMRGTPATMQNNPAYACAPLDVYDALAGRVAACLEAGIPRTRLAVDPGIGFGKTMQHNLEILRHIGLFHGLGCPIALGVSRKLKIGPANSGIAPKSRGSGTLAAVLAAADLGVQILRVHDVGETIQALEIQAAIATTA